VLAGKKKNHNETGTRMANYWLVAAKTNKFYYGNPKILCRNPSRKQ
jgi:hypothetical protein